MKTRLLGGRGSPAGEGVLGLRRHQIWYKNDDKTTATHWAAWGLASVITVSSYTWSKQCQPSKDTERGLAWCIRRGSQKHTHKCMPSYSKRLIFESDSSCTKSRMWSFSTQERSQHTNRHISAWVEAEMIRPEIKGQSQNWRVRHHWKLKNFWNKSRASSKYVSLNLWQERRTSQDPFARFGQDVCQLTYMHMRNTQALVFVTPHVLGMMTAPLWTIFTPKPIVQSKLPDRHKSLKPAVKSACGRMKNRKAHKTNTRIHLRSNIQLILTAWRSTLTIDNILILEVITVIMFVKLDDSKSSAQRWHVDASLCCWNCQFWHKWSQQLPK